MSGGGTNTVQSSQPNDIVAGHLGDLYNGSQLLANAGGPNINTGQVSPLNANQTSALTTLGNIGAGQSYGNLTDAQAAALGTGDALTNGTTAGQQGLAGIMNGTTAATQGLQAAGQANGTVGNQALSMLAQGGGAGSSALESIINGSNSGIQGLQSILNGSNVGVQGLASLINGSNTGIQGLNSIINGSNAGTQYLKGTLAPSYTNVAANPNLQAAMNAANYNTNFNFTNDVMPSLASQFSAAGRFGSGAQTEGINQATNNLATQESNTNSGLANQDYMQMLAQQSANAGTLGSLQSGASQAVGSLQSGASQALGGLQSTAGQAIGTLQGNAGTSLNATLQNAATGLNSNMTTANNALMNGQMQAGGALTNSQIAGANMLPALATQGANNAQLQLGAGSTQQQQSQAQLNALIAQMNQNANQPYTNMGWLSQILSGTAGIGGQSSSTTGNQANLYSTGLGAGLVGNSLYSSGALSALTGGSAAGTFGTPLFTAAIGSGAADTGGMSALMGLGGFMADAAPVAAAA